MGFAGAYSAALRIADVLVNYGTHTADVQYTRVQRRDALFAQRCNALFVQRRNTLLAQRRNALFARNQFRRYIEGPRGLLA
jgi:hypothetical protein